MNSPLQQNFSPRLIGYLEKLGFKDKEVSMFTYDTKIFHDLGVRGDTAEEFMIILRDMGVDMSNLKFDDYFPPEFHDRFFLNILPIPEKFLFKKEKYKPVTLSMIEKALDTGSWSIIVNEDKL